MTDVSTRPAALAAEDTASIYRKITWKLIPFLCLCYLAAYLDRINIGLAKLQMASDLALSETAFGLGAGLFFVGYILFEVPSNLILQRVGAKIWIARIMITWGLLSTATLLVQTPTQFYIIRFFSARPKPVFCLACCSISPNGFPRGAAAASLRCL